MAFDFPASPAVGDVYTAPNGAAYQWDAEKWKGGQPSGPVTEQLFDVSGQGAKDIVVPDWAVGAELTMSLVATATQSVIMRISLDGATFLSGASDYGNSAPQHDAAAGTPFNTIAQTTTSYWSLTNTTDSTAFPAVINSTLGLRRGNTSQNFTVKSRAVASHSTAGHRTQWYTGNLTVAAAGSALQIKALRIQSSIGVSTLFGPGSWIRVKWLGDAAQVPISNAIADSPHDGYPYQRVNGIWQRQKGVVQIKTFFDSTDYSRAAASEAILGAAQIFYPFYPDSKVYWEFASYITVTTNAANMDDLRGHVYGKYYDGVSAYVSVIGNTIYGHVNYNASTVASSVIYTNPQRCAPMDISTYRDPNYVPGGPVGSLGGGGRILMRMYGYPGYANSTLDLYETTMKFTEVLE